jgi:hypothetical protein
MITGRVPMGTRPVASLHWRSVAKSVVETTVTYATSFEAEMHAAGSKTCTEIGSMITMGSTMSGLIDSVLLKEGTIQEVSRPIPET